MLMQSAAAEDPDGLINYAEFLAQIVDKKLYLQEDLCWDAFREHDPRHTGFVDASVVGEILTKYEDIGASKGVALSIMKKLERSMSKHSGGVAVNFMEFA